MAEDQQRRDMRGLAIKERFDKKWIPEPYSGCWLWCNSAKKRGYGTFGIGSRTDKTRTSISAHRMAWIIYRGEIPLNLNVLHKCDTPLCVNPDHLFLGTQADNMTDKVKKHRQSILTKELNPRARLTESDVDKIRLSKLTHRHLAAQFGVTYGTIWKIKANRIWKQNDDSI